MLNYSTSQNYFSHIINANYRGLQHFSNDDVYDFINNNQGNHTECRKYQLQYTTFTEEACLLC